MLQEEQDLDPQKQREVRRSWEDAALPLSVERNSSKRGFRTSSCTSDEEQEFDDQFWPPRFVQSGGSLTRTNIWNTLVHLGSIKFEASIHLRPWSKDGVYMYSVNPDPAPRSQSGSSLSIESIALFERFYPRCVGQDLVDLNFQINTRGSEAGTITLSKWIADAVPQQFCAGVSEIDYPPPLCSGSVEIFVRISELCRNGLEKNVSTRALITVANTDRLECIAQSRPLQQSPDFTQDRKSVTSDCVTRN